MTHTIFAWTGPTPPDGYPPFVNISRDAQGVHTITVRGSGDGGRQIASTGVTRDVLRSLMLALLPPMPEHSTEAEGDAYTHGWFDGNEADPLGLPRWLPLEPTAAMLDAGLRCHDASLAPEEELATAYRAMVRVAADLHCKDIPEAP